MVEPLARASVPGMKQNPGSKGLQVSGFRVQGLGFASEKLSPMEELSSQPVLPARQEGLGFRV